MSATTPDTAPLTVVLVHGAFTDASSWSGVIERPPGRRGAGDGTPEPAARPLSRLGLHQVVPGADAGTHPCRRSRVHRRGPRPLAGRARRSHDHRGRGPGSAAVAGRLSEPDGPHRMEGPALVDGGRVRRQSRRRRRRALDGGTRHGWEKRSPQWKSELAAARGCGGNRRRSAAIGLGFGSGLACVSSAWCR